MDTLEEENEANNNHQEQTIKDKEEEDVTFAYAMQLVNTSVLPMAVQAAIDLGVFKILAQAGGAKLSTSQIAARLPTSNPDAPQMLDQILRLLNSYSVVGFQAKGTKRLYSLLPVGKYFVKNEDGVSLAPLMALTHDRVYMDSWSQLKDAVLEGGTPFNRVHGSSVFEHPSRDARFSQVYNTAMFNHTTILVKKILESYQGFEDLKTLVDVGGGIGVALSLITSKYPSIKGVKHVAGDMFESVPKGDAIFMKGILHNWSDDQCLKLLKNCYNAILGNAKVIIVEQVLPIYPEIFTSAKAKSEVDVLLMTQNPGGREWMQHELMDLATGAGFQSICFSKSVCYYWVWEFLK